ncbi:MAG: fumarate reductase iron-sulfur subunit [Gammaproteobacteria bacterium]|nr:fumarate reductase iron-sulfur subunit [Gammaproteobacteria bacterium]
MSASPQDEAEGRKLRIHIFKHNPRDPESTPQFKTFEIVESQGMTLFIVLSELQQHQDGSLQFDFVCRAGICGSCGMIINGRPGLACRTLTETLDSDITLAPLPAFELIGDLSVNTGKWMRGMSERLGTWIHDKETENASLDQLEDRMEPELASEIYELDRCVECGCCVAACGTLRMREQFVGAVGLNKIARFRLDPRDKRSDADYYELIGDDDGVFGCMSLLGCEDVCPKDLPLQSKIAYVRRKMVSMATK